MNETSESMLFGVSLRGWVVLMVVSTICIHTLACVALSVYVGDIDLLNVQEPFYSLVMIVIGYYFGQKTQPTGSQNGERSPSS